MSFLQVKESCADAAVHKKLLVFAFHLLGNKQDAQDAVQDACLALLQNKQEVCMAYVFATVRHKCVDIIRKKKNSRTNSADFVLTSVRDHRTIRPDHQPMANELARCVEEMILQERDLSKQIFYLRAVEDLSYVQIAEALAMDVDAVRSKYRTMLAHMQSRARVKFQTMNLSLMEQVPPAREELPRHPDEPLETYQRMMH